MKIKDGWGKPILIATGLIAVVWIVILLNAVGIQAMYEASCTYTDSPTKVLRPSACIRSWIGALSGWAAALIVLPTIKLLRSQIMLPTLERKVIDIRAEQNAIEHLASRAIFFCGRKSDTLKDTQASAEARRFNDEIMEEVATSPTICGKSKSIILRELPRITNVDTVEGCMSYKKKVRDFQERFLNPLFASLDNKRTELEAKIDRIVS